MHIDVANYIQSNYSQNNLLHIINSLCHYCSNEIVEKLINDKKIFDHYSLKYRVTQ